MLYDQLLNEIAIDLAPLQLMAEAIATLDVLCNLAERAQSLNLVCPTLSEQPGINIKNGSTSSLNK